MAIKTYVDGNSTLTVSNNDTTVIGASTGTQTVNVAAGVTGVSVDANIEKFTLTGNLADYKFVSVAGTGTQIQNAAGTVVATIPSLNQTASVTFADGAANLVQTGASSFTLGGQPVPATAAAITAASMGTNFAATNTWSLSGATTVDEGASATYTVSRAAGVAVATTVAYTITGTATSGTDYTAQTGTLSFAIGESSKTITVPVTADNLTEATAETMIVTLGAISPTTDVVLSGQGTVTTTIADTSKTIAGNSGLVFTTNIDVLSPGTAGNDTAIGDNTGTNATVTAGDQLDLGAGTDTFKYYIKATDKLDELVLPQISNVENLYVNGGALTTTKTFDATGITGITSVALDSPTKFANGESFTVKTASTQTLSLTKINVAAAGTATLNLNGAAAVTVNGLASSTTDTGTLTIDLTSVGTNLGITTTGANNTFTLANTGAALNTLTITGDKSATITENLANLKTVNAVNSTGAVSIDTSAGTPNSAFTFTGGSANDSVKLADNTLTSLTSTSQLDGGAGTGDKLGIKDTALTTDEYTAINTAKNFEVLGLNAAITVDASKLTTIKQFALDGNAAQIINNMATGSSVSVGSHATNVTLSAATGVNDVTLTVNGHATAAVTVGGTVSLSQTNVALVSSGTNATLSTIATLANADNSVITVTGGNDLTITNALAGTSIGSKVDANAFTGKLSVIGSALSDVLIGGSNADTLNGGAITAAATAVTGVKSTGIITVVGDATTAGDTYSVTVGTELAATVTWTTSNAVTAGLLATAINNLTSYDAVVDGTTTNQINVTATATGTAGNVTITTVTTDGGGTAPTAVDTDLTGGVTAVTAVTQSVDTLTGNGGADVFAFSSADLATTAGVVTATITDFKTGIDTIKVTNSADAGAGSATNYTEATAAVSALATLLSAADTALNGVIDYYVGQVGSDSYLVTDANGTGYTNVIKLTGVTLDQIAASDLVA